MYELYSSGNYSVKTLVEKMHEEGLRNNTGNKLVKSKLHSLLTDPFYIGKNRWNDKLYPGKQKTFISTELFDKVQSLLKSKTTPRYRKHNFLFKSVLKCAECTGTITWEVQKGITYGHCNHYKNCSQKTWSKEYEVEKQLKNGLNVLQIKNKRLVEWIRKALKESHKDEIEYYDSSQKELQEQHDRIKQRLDRLYDDRLDDKISEVFYESKFKQYSEEKERIVSSIQKHSQADTKYFQLGSTLYDLSQRATDIYKKAEINDKRQLLRLVFSKMLLDEGELSYEYTPAFKLLSEAMRFTNSSKLAKMAKIDDRIFEPEEKLEVLGKTDELYAQRSTLLPNPCHIIKTINIRKILKSFQNVVHIGVLRQRWEEIKRLQLNPNLTTSSTYLSPQV